LIKTFSNAEYTEYSDKLVRSKDSKIRKTNVVVAWLWLRSSYSGYLIIHHHHYHVHEGLGVFPVPW